MNKKVLIIENYPLVREVLVEFFKLCNYQCEINTSSLKSYYDYNFIVADYTSIKQLNLVETIMEISHHKPVIITVAAGAIEEKHLREKAKIIPKPFSFDDFKKFLNCDDEGFHKERQQNSLTH
jgi:DNA-binding NtrC family response regulator